MVKQGRVRLYHLTENGKDVTTAILGPGQLFGMGAYFARREDATFAEALEDTQVCGAAAQDFINMTAHHPILMAKVMMAMARQMLRLESTIRASCRGPVAGRLADLVITLAEQSERTETGAIVLPVYSHHELGKMVGTRYSTSPTSSRTRTCRNSRATYLFTGREGNQRRLCRGGEDRASCHARSCCKRHSA